MSLENIISKYLLNKADQLELDQLRVWQAEAHDNVQALKEIQQIFSLDMSDYKAYDTQNAWDKVAPHILEEKNKRLWCQGLSAEEMDYFGSCNHYPLGSNNDGVAKVSY